MYRIGDTYNYYSVRGSSFSFIYANFEITIFTEKEKKGNTFKT